MNSAQNESPPSSVRPNLGPQKEEHLFKVLVIGELGVGKTSVIKRYVHKFFSEHYRATIGVDFALKVINWDDNNIIRLQMWDIAGQERFGNMTRVYYKDAVGAFLVFDLTRFDSFSAVEKWKSDLDSKVVLPDGSPIPCILLGNKCDQPRMDGIVNNDEHMEKFCAKNGFTAWFPVSARENINVDEAASFLVQKMLDNDHLRRKTKENEQMRDIEAFQIGTETDRDRKRSGQWGETVKASDCSC